MDVIDVFVQHASLLCTLNCPSACMHVLRRTRPPYYTWTYDANLLLKDEKELSKEEKEFLAKCEGIVALLKILDKDNVIVGLGNGIGILIMYGADGTGTVLHLDMSGAWNIGFLVQDDVDDSHTTLSEVVIAKWTSVKFPV